MRILPSLLLLTCLFGSYLTGFSENIIFPPEAGVINVQEKYGAKGDGITDDTAAIQKLVEENKGTNHTLYFPNGTYLISDSVGIFNGQAHSRDRFLNFQGQSEAGVVLKLKDNCEGFGDVKIPKIMFSLFEGRGTGDAMHTYVRNMTVDVGQGNPGAVGLHFLANNTGAIYHVTVRSSDPAGAGYLGLDLRQHQQGPELIRYVTVIGFDRGVETQSTFSVVLEHLTLKNQREVGFAMTSGRITIRGLTSQNKVPVIIAGKDAQLGLVEGNFTGGDPAASAIVLETPKVYLRDLKQTGYGAMVETVTKEKIPGATLVEWVDGGGRGLFAKDIKSLRLPIKESPEVPWEQDFSKWQFVDYSQPDDTATLQKAIDDAAKAKKTTLFFAPGEHQYNITSPIRVHGSLNRILGMESIADVADPSGAFAGGKAVFIFDGLTSPVIVVERFFLLGGWKGPTKAVMFENKDGKTIVLQSLFHQGSTKNVSSSGEWFIDDVSPGRSGTLKVGRGEKVWARQYNPESFKENMIEVTGGQIWILGLKTEGRASHIIATDRARVELIGTVSYQSWDKQELDPPMFTIKDSAVSLSIGIYNSRYPFTTVVEETKSGQKKTLLPKDLANWHLGLYRSGTQ